VLARSTPSVRIGEAERLEAQRALQDHLNAGRLQVTEFVERFAGAADAVAADEIAALFADLPAPHPTLPVPPLGHTRRNLLIVGAVAALALGGLVGFVIGRGQPAPAPPLGAVATPVPSVSPATEPTAPPTESVEEGPGALPDSATVRRSTGPGLITLRPSDGVDLDDPASPTWNVGTGCCGRDVGFAADASRLSIDAGHVVVTGPLAFTTCFHETGYTNSAIERSGLQPGQTICVRTDGHRLALVTIVSASERSVEFGATVWDPPIPP
jgi:Domain of unknown function (DUF1707)